MEVISWLWQCWYFYIIFGNILGQAAQGSVQKWVQCLGTWVSGEHRGPGLVVPLNECGGLSQPKGFCDSRIFVYDVWWVFCNMSLWWVLRCVHWSLCDGPRNKQGRVCMQWFWSFHNITCSLYWYKWEKGIRETSSLTGPLNTSVFWSWTKDSLSPCSTM